MTAVLSRLMLRFIDSGSGKYITSFNDVVFQSWLSTWLIPFAALGIAGFCYYLYSREKILSKSQRTILVVLRSLAYVSLLLILAVPVLDIEGEGALPGPLPVVVDGSESMLIEDVEGGTRIKKALSLLEQCRSSNPSEEELVFKPVWAGKTIEPLDGGTEYQPDAGHTSLNQLMEKTLQPYLGEYNPGILLLTDGAHNTGELPEHSIEFLRKRNIPVFACGIGKSMSKDVAATYILGEDVVFVNEKAKIYVNIYQVGFTQSEVRLRLFLGDKKVYTGMHTLDEKGEISIPVEYVPPEKGYFTLKARVEPLPGEVTGENNTYIKNIRVIDEKIKILMVFGMPSWEYRYLAGAFERDKRVEFEVFMPTVDSRIFRGDSDKFRFIQKLPESIEELNSSYDIVFMSRIDTGLLPQKFIAALREFVQEKAGALAVLSDPSFVPYTFKGTELEDLLPVTLDERAGATYRDELFNPVKEEMKLSITDDGNAHQLVAFSGNKKENREIWSELPPIYSYFREGRLKPSSISLLVVFHNRSRQKYPAIAFHSFGKGTVLFMGFDSTWRWRREFGDRYFRDYWGKAVQFLGLPHLLEEVAQSSIFVGKENCSVGEKLDIRAKVNNPDFSPYIAPEVELKLTENELEKTLRLNSVPDRPGMFRGAYMPELEGILKIELPGEFSAKPVELRISKQQKELQHPGMNRELLEKICSETNGKFFPLNETADIMKEIYENRPKRQIKVSISLWDSFPLLILTLVLFGMEWFYRKLYHLD